MESEALLAIQQDDLAHAESVLDAMFENELVGLSVAAGKLVELCDRIALRKAGERRAQERKAGMP